MEFQRALPGRRDSVGAAGDFFEPAIDIVAEDCTGGGDAGCVPHRGGLLL